MAVKVFADIRLQAVQGLSADYSAKLGALKSGGYVISWLGGGFNHLGELPDVFSLQFSDQGVISNSLNRFGNIGTEQQTEVTPLEGGGYAVSWVEQAGHGQHILFQIFDASGNPVGERKQADETSEDFRSENFSVIALSDGGFALAWQGSVSGGSPDVYVRHFDVDGNGGDAVRLRISHQDPFFDGWPEIVELADGRSLVSWSGIDSFGVSRIGSQIFYSDGSPLGPIFRVAGDAHRIAPTKDGGFILLYHRTSAEMGKDIFLDLHDQMGAVVASAQLRGGTGFAEDYASEITFLESGRFVVAWTENTGNKSRVLLQLFDETAAMIGEGVELRGVSTDEYYFWNNSPQVLALRGGGYVALWKGTSVQGLDLVYLQRFDPDGELSGDKLEIHPARKSSTVTEFTASALPDGGFVVAMSGALVSSDGQHNDIFLQRFDADFVPVSQNCAPFGAVVLNGVAREGEVLRADVSAVIDADGNGKFFYQWLADGLELAGETRSSLVLRPEHIDRVISVRVSYTDRQGTAESLMSAESALVEVGVRIISDETYVLPENDHTVSLVLSGEDAIDGTGNSLDNLIIGNSADNRIDGLIGADTMHGGAGNDVYVVDERGDRVHETTRVGGTIDAGGHDTVVSSVTFSLNAYAGVRYVESLVLSGILEIDGRGNALANSISGNSASNLLRGEGGNDTLLGGGGDDRLLGGVGHDVLRCGAGGDEGYGGAGNDQLFGDGGNDTLYGGAGGDTLSGGASKDILRGDGGNDALLGDGGNDTLYGGAGRDTLTGGAGADLFVFMSVRDSPSTSARDTITDFVRGVDVIDLAGIDADTTIDGDQAFAFMGRVAFSGIAGQLILRTITGTQDSLVLGDVNGDGTADFSIRLTGIQQLAAEDFIL